jgi:hypothetical protein
MFDNKAVKRRMSAAYCTIIFQKLFLGLLRQQSKIIKAVSKIADHVQGSRLKAGLRNPYYLGCSAKHQIVWGPLKSV